jgi:hypothetical protein
VGTLAHDMYNYFETKRSDIAEDLKDLARTVIQCIDAATNASPIGWLKVRTCSLARAWNRRRPHQARAGVLGFSQDVVDVAKIAFDASDIYSKCDPLVGDLKASSFNAHQTGMDAGICLHRLVAEFSHRRRDAPAGWTCAVSHYNEGAACHLR